MAYFQQNYPNGYQFYPQYQQQTPLTQLQVQPQQPVVVILKNGIAEVNDYLVGAGQSAWLIDYADKTLYIKSTDTSGMPLPLRIFDFNERTAAQNVTESADMSKYVTKDELAKALEALKGGEM